MWTAKGHTCPKKKPSEVIIQKYADKIGREASFNDLTYVNQCIVEYLDEQAEKEA